MTSKSMETPNPTEAHRAGQRLAAAMRSGLDLRWSIPGPPLHFPRPYPPGGHVRAFLEPHADALNSPIPRYRYPFQRVVRGLRFALRKLLSPWLGLQRHFNLSTVSVLEQLEQRVRNLEEANRTLRQTVERMEELLKASTAREQH